MQVNTIRGTTKANIKKTDQMQRMRRTSFNDWHRRWTKKQRVRQSSVCMLIRDSKKEKDHSFVCLCDRERKKKNREPKNQAFIHEIRLCLVLSLVFPLFISSSSYNVQRTLLEHWSRSVLLGFRQNWIWVELIAIEIERNTWCRNKISTNSGADPTKHF